MKVRYPGLKQNSFLYLMEDKRDSDNANFQQVTVSTYAINN